MIVGANIAAAIGAVPLAPGGAAEIEWLGDSISAGGQTDPAEGRVVHASELVCQYLGPTAWSPSVAGESMAEIAVRQGGSVINFTVPGGVIPASTDPFPVTLVPPAASNFTGSTAPDQRSVFTGVFLGVPVAVRYTGTAWSMVRVTIAMTAKPRSGSRVVVPRHGWQWSAQRDPRVVRWPQWR